MPSWPMGQPQRVPPV